MKNLFTVKFESIYPVEGCLVILADDAKEARNIAKEIIPLSKKFRVTKFKNIKKSGVVVYMSGNKSTIGAWNKEKRQIPSTCLRGKQIVIALIDSGIDPCKDCGASREICKGRSK